MKNTLMSQLVFLFFISVFPHALATENNLNNTPENNIKNSTKSHAKDNTKQIYIPAFTANYTILHKSDPVGKAIRKLEYLDDGTANFSYKTDSQWFIITDKRKETTHVTFESNNIVPLYYKYTRKGTGRNKRYEWLYDPKNNTGENIAKNQHFTFDFNKNLQNPLSYHLQHRIRLIENQQNQNNKKEFSYQVIKTSGKVKAYTFVFDAEEELILPYGLLKTVRYKREVKAKKRITYAWFAPELNFLMVRLYQVKGGTGQLEAQLTSLKIDEVSN